MDRKDFKHPMVVFNMNNDYLINVNSVGYYLSESELNLIISKANDTLKRYKKISFNVDLENNKLWDDILNPIDEVVNEKKQKTKGYVYLMKDFNTEYFKIGFSKDPKYRERTLQSEKPTIALLAKFKGTNKDEKNLHKHFKEYRIRGEWFNLNKIQISYIKNYFK